VVLKLEVIPLVNSKNEITMQIALISDEQNGNQIIEGAGTNGGDLTVPRISTREIITTATVPNGETIVLGGLIIGKKNKDKSGIPILGDIPVVGKIFSTTTENDDRNELLIFIQPSIVGGTQSLDEIQTNTNNRYTISTDARAFTEPVPVAPVVEEAPKTEKTSKRSLRPAHRR
jgi:type II secretory pathway component GspD/PulD (secretin)